MAQSSLGGFGGWGEEEGSEVPGLRGNLRMVPAWRSKEQTVSAQRITQACACRCPWAERETRAGLSCQSFGKILFSKGKLKPLAHCPSRTLSVSCQFISPLPGVTEGEEFLGVAVSVPQSQPSFEVWDLPFCQWHVKRFAASALWDVWRGEGSRAATLRWSPLKRSRRPLGPEQHPFTLLIFWANFKIML